MTHSFFLVVRRTLGDTNEEGIRGFYKSLLDAKHVVGGDLQRNVYRNYTEFVSISKEISNLDADVLSVKEYLNELKSIWESFLAATNSSDISKVPGNCVYLPDKSRAADNTCRICRVHLCIVSECEKEERPDGKRPDQYLQSANHGIVG